MKDVYSSIRPDTRFTRGRLIAVCGGMATCDFLLRDEASEPVVDTRVLSVDDPRLYYDPTNKTIELRERIPQQDLRIEQ